MLFGTITAIYQASKKEYLPLQLSNRKQRVFLNGQVYTWTSVNAGVPQGSILGPLLFLIYINDLFDNLSSNVKVFTDDTYLFSVIRDINVSARKLNENLKNISEWAFQWKMIFNPDPNKQAQEVIFSQKIKKPHSSSSGFQQCIVSQTNSQKHLGVTLDLKLTFEEHLLNVFETVNRTIDLMRKLQSVLPRITLVTIYKAFVRPHLDYGISYTTKLLTILSMID